MSITATVIPNNTVNASVDSGNKITSTITSDLQLKSNVTIDSREDKIVATTVTIGDLTGIFDDITPGILDSEFSTFYAEYTYSNDDLNRIDIWESDNKGSLLLITEI